MSEFDRLFEEAHSGIQVMPEKEQRLYMCGGCDQLFPGAQFRNNSKICKACRKKEAKKKARDKFDAAKRKYKNLIF